MRKVPSLPPSFSSHGAVGIIYLPLATTTVPQQQQQQERRQLVARGGGGGPADRPTNHAASDCGSGSKTEFGHISNLIRALRTLQTEGGREGGGAEAERRSLHTTTTLHFVRFLSGERTSERSGRSVGRSLVAVVRLFVGILNPAAVTHSVRPCCNISARVIAFAEDSR